MGVHTWCLLHTDYIWSIVGAERNDESGIDCQCTSCSSLPCRWNIRGNAELNCLHAVINCVIIDKAMNFKEVFR